MAKQIKHIDKQEPNRLEEQTQAMKELLDVTAENHEALLKMMEIIKELNDAGILDMIKGMLKTRHKLGVLAVEQLNQPSMHRIIKNGTYAMEFMAKIDPDQLQKMLNGVTSGLEKSSETNKENQMGLWGMVKTLRDPDVNASMTTLLSFLQGMGQQFNKKTAQ